MTPKEQQEKLRKAIEANPANYNVASDNPTPEQEMLQRYHNVFVSAEGRIVLGDIASLGHVFDTLDPNDIAKVSERNFALVIMQMAGAFNALYISLGIAQP